MRLYRLENPVQNYAWGSVDGIGKLFGIANPERKPQAEVWMGAHPSAPSLAVIEDGKIGLDKLIQTNPEVALGSKTVAAFGPGLPFLFKILSAGSPLSIQTHPCKEMARLGFQRENSAGLPLAAPERSYRDANHKPEMAIALTCFELLCGFRPIDETIQMMNLAIPGEFPQQLKKLASEKSKTALARFFEALMKSDSGSKDRILASARGRIPSLLQSHKAGPKEEAALDWVMQLMQAYPGDIGALAPLFLNHVILQPGQAIFTAPGELHAHLRGTCLEIMANSDNVIRGGLTPKFINLPELLSVLSFNAEKSWPLAAIPLSLVEAGYPAFCPDFDISRITLGPGQSCLRSGQKPEILLCLSGEARIQEAGEERPLALTRGQSVFVAADAKEYRITAEREALLFRASVGELP